MKWLKVNKHLLSCNLFIYTASGEGMVTWYQTLLILVAVEADNRRLVFDVWPKAVLNLEGTCFILVSYKVCTTHKWKPAYYIV